MSAGAGWPDFSSLIENGLIYPGGAVTTPPSYPDQYVGILQSIIT
jgi:hypothetical protein